MGDRTKLGIKKPNLSAGWSSEDRSKKHMVWVFAKSCFIQHGIWESNMASWEISTWGLRAGRIIELNGVFSSHVCVRWLCLSNPLESPLTTRELSITIQCHFFEYWVDIHYLGGWWYWWRSFSPSGTKQKITIGFLLRCFINGILGINTAKKPSYICDCL